MLVRRRGRQLAFAVLALTFAVTGCGSANPDADVTQALPTTQQGVPQSPELESEEASPDQSPVEEAESPVAEESQSPAAESGKSPTTSARTRGIRGKLLTAEQLPGFNDEFRWSVRSTRMREGKQPFGTCHKFAMTSIGAEKVVVRSYAPTQVSPGSTASHLVAEFADKVTARRVFEVLKSWARQCDEELREYDRSTVGRLKSVPVEARGALGHWYLLAYGPAPGDPDAGYFDAQGLARVGRTIAALEMRVVGQDYNYPSGKEPMVTAVQNATTRIS